MASQNGIVGDEYGIDIPTTQVDANVLTEEQKAARFSKKGEFKKLEAHWDATIKKYQQFLPDGRDVATVSDPAEAGRMWIVANRIIQELENVKNYYETAREVVEKDVR